MGDPRSPTQSTRAKIKSRASSLWTKAKPWSTGQRSLPHANLTQSNPVTPGETQQPRHHQSITTSTSQTDSHTSPTPLSPAEPQTATLRTSTHPGATGANQQQHTTTAPSPDSVQDVNHGAFTLLEAVQTVPLSQHEDRDQPRMPGVVAVAKTDSSIMATVLLHPETEFNSFFWAQAYTAFDERHEKSDIELLKGGEGSLAVITKLEDTLSRRKRENKGLPPKIERAIRNVLVFKDISVAAAQFDPLRAAPTIVRGVCNVLQVLVDGVDQQAGLLNAVEDITTIIRHWGNIEYLYLRRNAETTDNRHIRVEASLLALYGLILEFILHLIKICKHGTTAQIFGSPGAKVEMTRQHLEVKTRDSRCKQEFEDCQKIGDECLKIREWVFKDVPEKAYMDMCERIQLDKYPGCGQWLLDSEEYKSWEAGNTEVLWIRGTVGTGKTSLMTRVIQHHAEASFMHKDRRLAYIFCTNNYGDQSPKRILKSILRQIIYNHLDGSIAQKARDMYNESERLPFESIQQCKDLFDGILRAGIKIRIVIDALDECEDWKDLLDVFSTIHGYATTPNQFQLLVTGRVHVRVDEKFRTARKIDVVATRTASEIRHYITRTIETCPKNERPAEGEYPALQHKLVEILVNKANGMFIWVKLQLAAFLKPEYAIFDETTFEDMLQTLENQPLANADELHKVYASLLQKNSKDGTNERILTTFIFQLMLCKPGYMSIKTGFARLALTSARPVLCRTSKSSQNASITAHQAERLVQNFISKCGENWEFSHASVIDFLQKEFPLLYNETACHTDIVRVCVGYLMNNPCMTLSELSFANAQVRIEPQIDWVDYALRQFPRYYRALSKEARQSHDIDSLLINWIADRESPVRLQDWLNAQVRQVMQLQWLINNEFDDIVEALISSPAYLEKSLCAFELSACLRDSLQPGKKLHSQMASLFIKMVTDKYSHEPIPVCQAFGVAFFVGDERSCLELLSFISKFNRDDIFQAMFEETVASYKKIRHPLKDFTVQMSVLVTGVIDMRPPDQKVLFMLNNLVAYHGNEQAMEQLWGAGAYLTGGVNGRNHVLFAAVRGSHLAIVKLVLAKCASQDHEIEPRVISGCAYILEHSEKKVAADIGKLFSSFEGWSDAKELARTTREAERQLHGMPRNIRLRIDPREAMQPDTPPHPSQSAPDLSTAKHDSTSNTMSERDASGKIVIPVQRKSHGADEEDHIFTPSAVGD